VGSDPSSALTSARDVGESVADLELVFGASKKELAGGADW